MLIDDFTMVIPTNNRPRMLCTALSHYLRSGFTFRIVVVDSSSDEVQSQNTSMIEKLSELVTHARYPANTAVSAKFFDLPTFIETPFGMYAPDDDVVFIEGILRCLEFLRVSPDYVGCHGIYYEAALQTDAQLRVDVAWASISLDLELPLDRIFALCQRYQPIFYSVQRRSTLMASRAPTQVASTHFLELYNAFRILIDGKVAALPTPYMVRNEQFERGLDFLCDPNNWIMRDTDEMSREFVRFRDLLAKELTPFVTGRSAAQSIELAYMSYFIHAVRINTMLTRLEREGDLQAGSAEKLIARTKIGNSATDLPESLHTLLRSFMSSGWPRFG